MLRRCLCVILLLSLVSSLGVGCSDDVDPVVIDDTKNADEQPGDTGFDAASVDADAAREDADENAGEPDRWEEYENCLEQEQFERPPDNLSLPIRVYDDDDFPSEWTMGWSRRGTVRPPIPVDAAHVWLDEGEYFVFDDNRWVYGQPWAPREFELFVLREGEPIPFALAVVDDDEDEFVSNDEIESWDDDEYDTSFVVEIDNESTVSFSLVVPPWAFEEKGLHNLRIVGRPIWEEAEQWGDHEEGVYFYERPWFVVNRWVFERIQHVYYGSECDIPHRDIPRLQMGEEADLWETPEAANFVFQFGGLFLAPPLELYDGWTDIPIVLYELPNYTDEFELNQVFESPWKEVTLNLYVADHRHLISRDSIRFNDETLYLVMRDGEIIDEFLLEDVPINLMGDYYEEEGPGARVPIDVELTEDVATYQVVAIPRPFDEYDPDADDERRRYLEPRTTSAIQMRHVPEKGR